MWLVYLAITTRNLARRYVQAVRAGVRGDDSQRCQGRFYRGAECTWRRLPHPGQAALPSPHWDRPNIPQEPPWPLCHHRSGQWVSEQCHIFISNGWHHRREWAVPWTCHCTKLWRSRCFAGGFLYLYLWKRLVTALLNYGTCTVLNNDTPYIVSYSKLQFRWLNSNIRIKSTLKKNYWSNKINKTFNPNY